MTTPATAVAAVAGKRGGTVTVTGAGARYDVVAGQVTLRGVEPGALRTFGRNVLDHLAERTGIRPVVPLDGPFPASAALAHGGTELRLLDDGEDVVLMAFSGTDKGGTGTGTTLGDVRAFATTLRDLP